MDTYKIHDLKTERRDVSRGLPGYLMLAPIMFYLTMVLGVAGAIWFELGKRQAQAQEANWMAESAQFKSQALAVGKERTKVEALNQRARFVTKWIEGAHNLQPLCVGIGRGTGDRATIAELLLSRNSEIPSQIHLTLRMNEVDSTALDGTLQAIRDLDYRAYSAQQQKNQATLDYKATLIWRNQDGLASN